MEILDEIRTEQNRVVFLKSVAEQLLVKARVKLNLKNLYQANGYAVKELLKVWDPEQSAALLLRRIEFRRAGGRMPGRGVALSVSPLHLDCDAAI
jgi:clusterin-associated protein 1